MGVLSNRDVVAIALAPLDACIKAERRGNSIAFGTCRPWTQLGNELVDLYRSRPYNAPIGALDRPRDWPNFPTRWYIAF